MIVQLPKASYAETAVAIAARRSCTLQWRIFMDALVVTLPKTVGDEQALHILAKTGDAIAAAHPLPKCESVEQLQAALNDALDTFDWGTTELRETPQALELTLVGYPLLESIDAQTGFAAVLEAAFDTWISAQSTQAGLAMRLAERGIGDYPPLVFRYQKLSGS
jgi:Cellulose synthase subunit D